MVHLNTLQLGSGEGRPEPSAMNSSMEYNDVEIERKPISKASKTNKRIPCTKLQKELRDLKGL
jgi:hypothetical protein